MKIEITKIIIGVTVDLPSSYLSKKEERLALEKAESYLFSNKRDLLKSISSETSFQDVIDSNFDPGESGEYDKFPPNITFSFLFEK